MRRSVIYACLAVFRELADSNKFEVFDSAANFFVMRFANERERSRIKTGLERYRIYVRELVHGYPVENSLRITVGTRAQMEVFLEKFQLILEEG